MLVFFGFVATVGSAYVQVEYVPGAAWWGSLVVGLLACAILLANNVRDVPTDTASGKRTLAVRRRRANCARAVRRVLRRLVRGGRRDRRHAAVGAARPPGAAAGGASRSGSCATAPIPPSLVAALVATSRLEVVVAVLVSVGLCLVLTEHRAAHRRSRGHAARRARPGGASARRSRAIRPIPLRAGVRRKRPRSSAFRRRGATWCR